MATEKQIRYLEFLARKAGKTLTQAREDFFGMSGFSGCLSGRDASDLIDWLKS